MKTQEHTAGLWHLMKKCQAYDPPCDVIISEHIDDAIICSMGGDVPEVEANARLIAAAPQLLEALIECEIALRVYDEPAHNSTVNKRIARERALAAIRSAKGADRRKSV